MQNFKLYLVIEKPLRELNNLNENDFFIFDFTIKKKLKSI